MHCNSKFRNTFIRISPKLQLKLIYVCKYLGHKTALYFQMKDHVIQFPDRTSLVPVPNPFVVPGDRFQETYYW